MEIHQITVKSWNRFITRNLAAAPEVLGKEHRFTFENRTVSIKIPSIDQADRGKGYDEVVSVRTRRAIDNEPLEFHIHKVDVEVSIPNIVSVPAEALDRPPNAYDLFSDEEQKRLSKIAEQHQSVAEKAFEYWIRVTRWVCDDSRIGQDQVEDFRSGWGTYLIDTERNTGIWTPGHTIYVSKYKSLNLEEWREIQSKLSENSQPPIYVELKYDAEEHIRLGDYRRSLIDMAIACETFLRISVLQSLPKDLNPKLSVYIEEANINQYINHFFAEIIDETANKQFKKIKSDLHSLTKRRNDLVHMGKDDGIDEKLCLRFLKVTQELLSIVSTVST
jgi:hypothetical protein